MKNKPTNAAWELIQEGDPICAAPHGEWSRNADGSLRVFPARWIRPGEGDSRIAAYDTGTANLAPWVCFPEAQARAMIAEVTAGATLCKPSPLNPEGKPFRFQPLRVYQGSAGELTVICTKTKARAVWNDAARAGWVADLNGKAFAAYYSPEGRAKVMT